MGVAVGGAGVAADLVMRISELLLLTELFGCQICISLISNRYDNDLPCTEECVGERWMH